MQPILYLHGFNSSPLSFKAQALLKRWRAAGLPAEKLYIPTLPNDPRAAIALADAWLQQQPDAVLVGSSLGGCYATYLAEKYGSKALLINPAVRPWLRFHAYLGPQQNYSTGERWELTAAHVEALAQLKTPPPQASERFVVWLQTGDETLDYREAVDFYRGCQLDVQQGGDHGYQGFAERIPELLAFAGYTV